MIDIVLLSCVLLSQAGHSLPHSLPPSFLLLLLVGLVVLVLALLFLLFGGGDGNCGGSFGGIG